MPEEASKTAVQPAPRAPQQQSQQGEKGASAAVPPPGLSAPPPGLKAPAHADAPPTPPPGLSTQGKTEKDELRLVELDKVDLGMRVRVTIAPEGEKLEGSVYTIDPVTDTMVLLNPIQGSEESEIRLIFPHAIKRIAVLEESTEDLSEDLLPPLDPAEVEKREKEALEEMERALAQINVNASPEAQALFDGLARTMDCTWQENSIVVLDQIRIDPPYVPDSCHSLDGDEGSLERIRKIVTSLNKRIAKQILLQQQQQVEEQQQLDHQQQQPSSKPDPASPPASAQSAGTPQTGAAS